MRQLQPRYAEPDTVLRQQNLLQRADEREREWAAHNQESPAGDEDVLHTLEIAAGRLQQEARRHPFQVQPMVVDKDLRKVVQNSLNAAPALRSYEPPPSIRSHTPSSSDTRVPYRQHRRELVLEEKRRHLSEEPPSRQSMDLNRSRSMSLSENHSGAALPARDLHPIGSRYVCLWKCLHTLTI